MKRENTCEYCHKIFEVPRKNQKGRFCSKECTRKLLRKDQLKKYADYLVTETEGQKMLWLKEHYEKFVIKNENDCWDWNGCKVDGYANFNHRGKIIKAHRVSWIIHNGAIPQGMFVLHKCDVRHCSNPDHLFLGTHTDNIRDMASKHRTGVKCKLTLDQVYEIKNLLGLEIPMTKIAKRYGVSNVAILNIKQGKTWKKANI
jgi:hypothetical protein